MNTVEQVTPGRAAYEAYRLAILDRNEVSEASRKPSRWDEMGPNERAGWEAAAEAGAGARKREQPDQDLIDGGLPALLHFADTWRELLTALPDDYGCHLNCAEANAAADLYRALGDEDTAASVIAAHAAYDAEGDQHYQDGGPRRIVSAPSVPELEAIGNGPLLDPDCRDGKHASCLGAPCECPVPGVHSARHEHERSQP